MTRETKWLGLILIATVILLFGGVFLLSRGLGNNSENDAVLPIDYSKGQKIGSDSAKVKLVEFSDFECPACAAVEPFLVKVRSSNPNEVQFIYRHFPLPQHAHARNAAYFAEAAGEQGKFWEMHDRIFQTQNDWVNLSESDTRVFFMDLAKQLGLDEGRLKDALENNTYKTQVEGDLAEGQRLGVNSTPTFFLNGRKLNLQSFNDLERLVSEEIKR